jgi:hypothetical protein
MFRLKKQSPFSKINKAKRAGGMAQAKEYLSRMFRVLSSNLNVAKKERKHSCLVNI